MSLSPCRWFFFLRFNRISIKIKYNTITSCRNETEEILKMIGWWLHCMLPSGPIYSNMSAGSICVCVFFFYLLKTGQNKIKKKTWNSCWVDRGRRVNFIWYYAKTSKRENKILNQTSQGLDVYMSSFLYPFWFVFFFAPLSLSLHCIHLFP
jgi:hypothetical protein